MGNIELRVPVWGAAKRQLEYGPWPIDAFVFADGGVVWSARTAGPFGLAAPGSAVSNAAASFGLPATRRTVISSIGIGVRMNAGGLPFEVSAVRALDGPTPGWSADFGFRTGF